MNFGLKSKFGISTKKNVIVMYFKFAVFKISNIYLNSNLRSKT